MDWKIYISILTYYIEIVKMKDAEKLLMNLIYE